MTMQFRLGDPKLARGVKVGDRMAFSFVQTPDGPVVRTLQLAAGR
jgi:Cu(I)/Ag(I) efflux system membrane fusion protein